MDVESQMTKMDEVIGQLNFRSTRDSALLDLIEDAITDYFDMNLGTAEAWPGRCRRGLGQIECRES